MTARTRSSVTLRARAMRGACQSAASGGRSGSRPLAEAVTSASGIGSGAVGFSFWSRATSATARSRSFLEVVPKFDPDEEVAS